MQSLFGIPIGPLAVVLVIALAFVVSVVSALALRNRVFFKLGVRNVRRRRGADGADRDRADARHDDHRGGARVRRHDEPHDPHVGDRVARLDRRARLRETARTSSTHVPLGDATSVDYFSEDVVPLITHELLRSPHFDGVAPAIVEPVAVQNLTARQNEPRVTLFASTGPSLAAFGDIRTERRLVVTLDDLRPGEIYLNADAADDLSAESGHTIRVLAGSRHARRACSRASCEFDGTGTDGAALLVGLAGRPAAARPPARGQARADLERRRTRRAASATRTRSSTLLQPTAAAARARDRSRQAGRARGSRPGGQRVHVALHDVRQLLDLRRVPADLPDLRDARGRAPRRARDRPGDRHAARTPDPDVPLRGPRLRPARRGRRRSARRRGGVRHGLRPGERARQPRASRSSTTFSGAACRRVRGRRAADLRRRRSSPPGGSAG